MPKKKTDSWKDVHTAWDMFDATAVVADGGWMLPRNLKATSSDGDVSVEVRIEVADGKARARSVTITSDRPHGVGWTTLATLPVRNIVATACLDALRHAEPTDADGTMLRKPPAKKDAGKVRQIIQDLVGYKPKVES